MSESPASGVYTPAPAKTEFLGPGAIPKEVYPAKSRDFLSFLGPNNQLGTIGSLGHYEILEVLGRGGFGIVLKAFDEKLHRHVAIKVLDPAVGVTSPARKSFLREARSAAKVRHENVVQIYSVEEYPLPYLVMEFIEGETLHHHLDTHGPLESAEVIRLGRQICEGLASAHDQGLIHRDIKPANILLEGGIVSRVKITDFGVARTVDDANQTQSGVVVGTPMYMAPEQANAETIDQRADLFSLGSVLYTMASGRPPFRAQTSMAVINRVINDRPRPIRQIVPDVPEALVRVIEKLHAKKPADRYGDAREVASALAGCGTASFASDQAKTIHGLRRIGQFAACIMVVLVIILGMAFFGRWIPEPPPMNNAVALSDPPAKHTPTDPEMAWIADVASRPAGVQLQMVGKKLKELNPGFDPHGMNPHFVDGKVVGLVLNSSTLTDVGPLRALPDLVDLEFEPSGPSNFADLSGLRGMKLTRLSALRNPIADLSPLEGMPLVELALWGHKVFDLSPLRGMPLRYLNCGAGPVKNLSPLAGMPLVYLCANYTQVSDLSPLKGMPLEFALFDATQISDLSPLKGMQLQDLATRGTAVVDYSPAHGMPLKSVGLNFDRVRDTEWLQNTETLKVINATPKEKMLGTDK